MALSKTEVSWLPHDVQRYCWKPYNLLQLVCEQTANKAVGSYKAERYVASLPFVCVFATLNACLFASVHASVCLPSSSGALAGQLKREGKAALLCTICQIWACLPICGGYWQVLARLNSWQREMNNWTCVERSFVGVEWSAFIHEGKERRQLGCLQANLSYR